MILEIRKTLKSKGFKTTLWIILFSIMGGGALITQLVRHFSGDDSWALRVNGQTISREDFQRAVFARQSYAQEMISEIRRQAGPYADFYIKMYGLDVKPEVAAKEQLISSTLIDQEVKKIGITLDEEYISRQLNDPQFVRSYLSSIIPTGVLSPGGGINQAALGNYLRRMRISPFDFERQIEEALKRYSFTQMIMPAVYIPEFMLQQSYIASDIPRSFSYVKIDYDKILATEKQKEITPEELKAFFDQQNKMAKHYWISEKRTGTMWRFDSGSYGIDISEEKIQAYYDKKKSREFVSEQPKVQMRRILFKVENPDQEEAVRKNALETLAEVKKDPSLFAQVAEKVSQDTDSAKKGGLLDYFSRGGRGEGAIAFEKAAFLLKNDGDISGVVKTNDGFEILQRVGRTSRAYKPLDAVRNDIRNSLIQKKFEKNFVGKTRNALKDKVAFETFAKDKSAKSEPITDKESDSSRLLQALFAIKKGKSRVYLDGQIGVVVRLDDIAEGHYPELESIAQQVKDDLYDQRAAQMMRSTISQLKEKATSGSLQDAARELGVKVQQTGMISPDSENELKKLTDQGVPANSMMQMTHKRSVFEAVQGNNGYLIRLDEVGQVDPEAFMAKKTELRTADTREDLGFLVKGYVDSLRKNAKIEVNKFLSNID